MKLDSNLVERSGCYLNSVLPTSYSLKFRRSFGKEKKRISRFMKSSRVQLNEYLMTKSISDHEYHCFGVLSLILTKGSQFLEKQN